MQLAGFFNQPTACVFNTQEVIGGAVAIYGMSSGAIPMWGGVLITCAVAYALLSFAEYVQRDFLQWFMMAVLAVLIVAFIILFARSTQVASELFKGIFVPALDGSAQVQAAVGCVGAVIMPYNLFLGSAIVLTRPKRVKAAIDNLRTKTIKTYVWLETALVLCVSLVINLLVCMRFGCTAALSLGSAPPRRLPCLPRAAKRPLLPWATRTTLASWTLDAC